MNKKSILSIIIALTMTFSVMIPSTTVMADKNYDVTAPVVTDMAIENSQDIDADGIISMKINVTEDGLGVNSVIAVFVSKETSQTVSLSYKVTTNDNNKLLFTGEHNIEFDLKQQKVYFVEGTYIVEKLIVSDVAGNENVYTCSSEILVTNSNIKDKTAPIINSIQISNPLDFKYDTYNEAIMSMDEVTGLKTLELIYRNVNGQEITVNSKDIEGLTTGTHKIKLYLETKSIQEKGTYNLYCVNAEDLYGNTRILETDLNNFTDTIVINSLPTEGKEGVSIQEVEIVEKDIVTPNVLSLNIKLNPGTEGLKGVNVSIINENGNKKALYWEAAEPVTNNRITIKLPINTYLENGSYMIDKITAYSDNFVTTYTEQSLNMVMKNNHSISIKGHYDVTYYGSTANTSGVIKAIENLKDGQVAIAEYSIKSIADKSIFQALAGRDVTLVLEGQDVQWVFNGKDIDPNKCKNIDLAVKMSTSTGRELGYADSDTVLVIDFMSNGELPGKAKIRLSNEYLKVKYSYKANMVLTYYDTTPELLDGKVNCSNDGYAEIEITHNSRYILSDTAPRLAAPGNFAVSGNATKSNIISWTKVFGASGYKVYRASGNQKTFNLIKTIEGNTTNSYTYIDESVTKGEIYYYRVCAYGSNVSAVYSQSKSIRVLPSKTTLAVKSVKKKKKKATVTMKTSDGIKNFVVYTSKNGKKYKKVKTLSNKGTCTIKLNKKKTYVKVRAYVVLDGKRYYGSYSKVIKIKK